MIPCKRPAVSGVKNHRNSASVQKCPGCTPSTTAAGSPSAGSLATPPPSSSAPKWPSQADRLLEDLDRGQDAFGMVGGRFGVTIKPSGEYEVYLRDGSHNIEAAPEGTMVHLKPRNANVLRTPSVPARYQVKKVLDQRYVHSQEEQGDQSHTQVHSDEHEGLNLLMDRIAQADGDPEALVAAVVEADEHIKRERERENPASVKESRGGMGQTEVFANTADHQQAAEQMYDRMMNDVGGRAAKRAEQAPARLGYPHPPRVVSDDTNLYFRDSGRVPIKSFNSIERDGDQKFTMWIKRSGGIAPSESFSTSGTKEEAVGAIRRMLEIISQGRAEADARSGDR